MVRQIYFEDEFPNKQPWQQSRNDQADDADANQRYEKFVEQIATVGGDDSQRTLADIATDLQLTGRELADFCKRLGDSGEHQRLTEMHEAINARKLASLRDTAMNRLLSIANEPGDPKSAEVARKACVDLLTISPGSKPVRGKGAATSKRQHAGTPTLKQQKQEAFTGYELRDLLYPLPDVPKEQAYAIRDKLVAQVKQDVAGDHRKTGGGD